MQMQMQTIDQYSSSLPAPSMEPVPRGHVERTMLSSFQPAFVAPLSATEQAEHIRGIYWEHDYALEERAAALVPMPGRSLCAVQSTEYTTPHSGRDRWMSKAAGGKQVPTVWREFCQPKQEPWVMCPPGLC
ncbi:hypothetical protein TESG_04306 [Trichophyton tonsurans CBS 112818]|uniref:Uncharacterized protein n=1 Tax=Trichophyton tonsurans (strain CBS 112818) TaxID=647933 RepID=F2RZT0_TRIT1|nr:hypothetical protein TESG_04306 [Trichophyton tonsurans CBS 112818]